VTLTRVRLPGNLDPETGGQILDLLEEMNREGRTVVMVTHDPRAAARAQRTLRLAEGRISSALRRE
jgi:putative ABC transport system ATP-binding protein